MGADYKTAHRGILQHSSTATVAANATVYIGVAAFPVENAAMQLIPSDGVIRAMRAHASGAPGVGETFSYTLMVNGIASILTCQTVNPNEISEDLVNQVVVARGDRIDTRLVVSLNGNARYHRVAYKFIPYN